MRRPSPRTRLCIAWCVTIGEAALLIVCAVFLSRYWLMAPVPIRNTAAVILLIATSIVIYRFVRFHRRRKETVPQPPPLPPNP